MNWNSTFRNIFAVFSGFVAGFIVNMTLIINSSRIIPPPLGVDVTTMEGLKANIHLFEPKHFIVPFLAHALGTFVGSLLAARLAITNKTNCATVVGIVFLLGGIANVMMLPSPIWFTAVDLVAYLPLSYIASRFVVKSRKD